MIANGPSPGGRPEYRPYRWATVDFIQWMLLESEYAAILREKRARVADFPELYYRTLPDQFRRSGSVLQCLIDGARYDLQDESIVPLQMSRFIEEDFMLIQEIEGAQMITAASRSPSSGRRFPAAVAVG